MTVLATIPADDALDEIVSAVADRVNDGIPVSAAVDEVLPISSLDSEAVSHLLRYGLIAYCNDRLHAMRTNSSSNSFRSRFMVRPLSGAAARTDVLRRILLSGADGMTKSLFMFTRDDCQAFIDLATGQIDGWGRKRDAMRLTAETLTQYGATQVSALPDEAVGRIADEVARAWTIAPRTR